MSNYQQYISRNPGIRFDRPCFPGTRITVPDIPGELAISMTTDEIMDHFPELTLNHIRAV